MMIAQVSAIVVVIPIIIAVMIRVVIVVVGAVVGLVTIAVVIRMPVPIRMRRVIGPRPIIRSINPTYTRLASIAAPPLDTGIPLRLGSADIRIARLLNIKAPRRVVRANHRPTRQS